MAAALVMVVMTALVAGAPPARADANADQRQTGLGLEILASHGTYKPGSKVTLTFRVTNHGTAACQVGRVPDGEVLIGSVTRNGASQPWHTSQVMYGVDQGAVLAASLVTVPPSGHVDVAVSALAGPQAAVDPLQTTSILPTGLGLASAWPLQSNGHYVVSARYKTPVLRDEPKICAGATNVATVAFTVGPAHTGFPWWWLLIALAVLVLLVALFILVRRRRRRGARTAAAVALVLLAVTATQVSRPAPAHADDFGDAISTCMAGYTGPGIKPGLMDKVKKMRDSGQLKIIRTDEWGDDTNNPWGPFEGLRPGQRLVIIQWDPVGTTPFLDDDGAENLPCTRLYHEMVHSETTADGTKDSGTCYLGGFPHATELGDDGFTGYEEVRTTEWENQYRLALGLKPRTRHDSRDKSLTTPTPPDPKKVGQPIPPVPDKAKGLSPGEQVQAALDTCSRTPIADPAAKPKSDWLRAGSILDPHLTTFDHLYYNFHAVGEFVLAKSRDDFEVQVRQAPIDSSDRTVSVNTAAAVRAGSDRVGFYDVDGDIQVHLGGKTVTVSKGSTKLPGGATLARRAGEYSYSGDGYDVIWPDGSIVAVDPLGSEALQVNVVAAAARKGTFGGLLGNFDGKAAGDLVSRDGKAIPDQPGREDLYHVFGDTWRLRQGESMLEYGPGQSTATFTDRAFPDKPMTVADLPQPAREQATAMCKAAGVTDPTLLDDCIVDVARTGQPSFAAAYAQEQRNLRGGSTTPTGPSRPGSGRTVSTPGAILQDGDLVTGSIAQAGGTVDYGLDLTANQQFELVEVTGSLSAQLPDTDVSDSMLPGPFRFAVGANGQAKLRISLPNGPGKYSFRYVTLKPRTIPIEVGAATRTGDLDEPGRVDIYRVSPPADVTVVQVNSTTSCDAGLSYGYSGDDPQPNVLSPGNLCFGYAHPVSPGSTELVLVWSEEAKTGSYSIGVGRS